VGLEGEKTRDTDLSGGRPEKKTGLRRGGQDSQALLRKENHWRKRKEKDRAGCRNKKQKRQTESPANAAKKDQEGTMEGVGKSDGKNQICAKGVHSDKFQERASHGKDIKTKNTRAKKYRDRGRGGGGGGRLGKGGKMKKGDTPNASKKRTGRKKSPVSQQRMKGIWGSRSLKKNRAGWKVRKKAKGKQKGALCSLRNENHQKETKRG